MKLMTVVGARPQFIKAAAVTRAIRSNPDFGVSEVMVHTGQHFDDNMSSVFFEELAIPPPLYNLGVAGSGHGVMTGRMLEALEPVIEKESPDRVLVYGDTNSTLAGVLAAAKLHIPVGHVEAGLRSFNMRMPEEINRVVADRISDLLFCPTLGAVENLRAEGRTTGVHLVGDVMYDVALHFAAKARTSGYPLPQGLARQERYVLTTCHRAENTDDVARLEGIFAALARIAEEVQVIFPIHPRTRNAARRAGLMHLLDACAVVEPLSYMDMIALEQGAAVILTDSGGVQKEAFFFQVPCVTVRNETEWVETVDLGWNRLVAADVDDIVQAVLDARKPQAGATDRAPYGQGQAAAAIVARLAGSGG